MTGVSPARAARAPGAPAATGAPVAPGPGAAAGAGAGGAIAGLLASAAILVLLLIFGGVLVELPLWPLCVIASACTILLSLLAFADSRRGVWSAPFAYLAVFWVFHFGLVFSYAIGTSLVEDEARHIYAWFFYAQARAAIVQACLGLAAFVTGAYAVSLARRFVGGAEGPAWRADAPGDAVLRHDLTWAGLLCVALGAAGWVAVSVAQGGVGLLVSDYETFLSTTARMPPTMAYFAIGVGMTLLALGERGSVRLAGFAVFGAWALVAFPLGLRGEVLFPLVTALVVAARRRLPLSTVRVTVLALGLLVAIALVKDLRQTGVANAGGTSSESVNPLAALTELGSSLRPVYEVVTWADQGEEPMYGATYWAPFDRAVTGVVPLWKRVPAEQDDRIMNVVVARRVGQIGFSVVAEAYRNFGQAGVIVVMALIGALLAWMESWPATPTRAAVLGLVMVELLFQVRNDFIAVPMQVGMGVALVLAVRFAAGYGRGGETGAPRAARAPATAFAPRPGVARQWGAIRGPEGPPAAQSAWGRRGRDARAR